MTPNPDCNLTAEPTAVNAADSVCIMVVDDDPIIVRFVEANLRQYGFSVIKAKDGLSALKLLEEHRPDMIILDIMMPEMDGDEVCRRVREQSDIPIIMLSARSEVSSRVNLLDCGADDYITKPFGIGELMARVKSLLRRKLGDHKNGPAPFISGDLQVDLREEMVAVGGRYIQMSPAEYRLLKELVLNAGNVIPQQTLLNRLWGPEYTENVECLQEYIDRLREKIETGTQHAGRLITESRSGYCLQLLDPPA